MASPAFLREPLRAKLGFRQRSEETLPSVVGEIPRGAMTEIAGPVSSGRTALLYSLLATASAGEEFCALLDVEDRFDPVSAAAAGVRLSQVLWVRCSGNVEHAMKSADMLAQAGGFGLAAIDLGDTSEPAMRRIPMPAWFRLRHAVENTRTALVVVARQLHARSCSAVKIELSRSRALWQGEAPARLLNGFEIACVHTRNHHEQQSHFVIPR
jgi:hypothetical protein